MNVIPLQATVLLDTQHFHETLSETASVIGAGYSNKPGRYYPAEDVTLSLGGLNHIPICGMLIPRASINAMPRWTFDRVTYFEDFAMLLHALLHSSVIPVVVDKLFAGISLRVSGNAVTEVDRTKWNASMSELVAWIACGSPPGALLTMPMPQRSRRVELPESPVAVEPLKHLSRMERTMVLTWRATRTAIRVALAPTRVTRRVAAAWRIVCAEGVTGLLRAMALSGRRG
jgi:hypothetical protein